MDLVIGNAGDVDTGGTGWFLGFSPWARRPASDLLYVRAGEHQSGLCVKWYAHPAGHESGPSKPVSEGRTLSILVGERASFRIDLAESPDFPAADTQIVVLERPGDFAAWGPGLFHRWRCQVGATILTLRWTPVPGSPPAADPQDGVRQ